jgi:hypothetical protein
MKPRRRTILRRKVVMGSRPPLATVGKVFMRQTEKPVPDWPDVAAMPAGPERKEAVATCARALWLRLSGMSKTGDQAFSPATLHQGDDGTFSLGTPGDGGVPGWRWDGMMVAVYTRIWPSLYNLLKYRHPSGTPLSAHERAAVNFRTETSAYLRWTGNCANISRGGGSYGGPKAGSTPPVPSVWFVAAKWNPEPPVRPVPQKLASDPVQARKEAKVTPHEAGEDREPAPVELRFACRNPLCLPRPQRFATPEERNDHETTHRKAAAVTTAQASAPARHANVPPVKSSAYVCRDKDCRIPYMSYGGRRNHEMTQHPEMFRTLYSVSCPFPSDPPCESRYEPENISVRLGHHLGIRGHGVTGDEYRQALTQLAITGKYPDGFEKPAGPSPTQASTTYATPSVIASATTTEAPAPTHAAPTRSNDDEKALENAALDYLIGLQADRADAIRERDELRARVAELEKRVITPEQQALLDTIMTLAGGKQ